MTDTTETIVTYTHDGDTYEIDHLGIGCDAQWGEFAVYCNNYMLAGFAIPESILKPECRPAELPVTNEELIRLAKQAVTEQAG